MNKIYNKGQGDTSVRIETQYKLNEAGAKQYVLDQIKELDSFDCSLETFHILFSRINGALLAFYHVGLIDIFNFEELKAKQAQSLSNFLDRLTAPKEQI